MITLHCCLMISPHIPNRWIHRSCQLHPLVNISITMENHHAYWKNSLFRLGRFQWLFWHNQSVTCEIRASSLVKLVTDQHPMNRGITPSTAGAPSPVQLPVVEFTPQPARSKKKKNTRSSRAAVEQAAQFGRPVGLAIFKRPNKIIYIYIYMYTHIFDIYLQLAR